MELTERLQQFSVTLRNCRIVDCITLDLAPSSPEILDSLRKLRAAWISAASAQIKATFCDVLVPIVESWMNPISNKNALASLPERHRIRAEHLIFITQPLEATVEELTSLRSDYDRYLYQIDFLLHAIGIIAAREKTWRSTLTDTAKTATTTVVPLIASIFAPIAAITLSMMKAASDAKSIATTKAATKSETTDRLAFFAFVRLLYDKPLQRLPALMINRITDIDRTISALISQDDSTAWITLLKRRQGVLLGGGCFAVGGNGSVQRLYDSSDHAAINLRVQGFLATYANHRSLEPIIDLIRENSMSNHPRRIQILLEGPPGTGKTLCANRLAEALGLPLIKVRIGNPTDFELLCGIAGIQQASEFALSSKEYSDHRVMTTVPYAMTKAGICNPILFIDEAGGLLSGSLGSAMSVDSVIDNLKVLFDESENHVSCPMISPEAKFDYSRMTVIVATNKSISEGNVDLALANRFWTFHFPALGQDIKRRALATELDTYSSTRLTEHYNKVASDECRKFLEYMVHVSEERGYVGLRELHRALKVVHSLCVAETAKYRNAKPDGWDVYVRECIELALPLTVQGGSQMETDSAVVV